MTKQASEIMKLNFMTDQGSNRDTIRWAWRADVLAFFSAFLSALVRLGTCCGLGIRDVAACQADGPEGVAGWSTRVVSASDGADGPDRGAGPDRAAGADATVDADDPDPDAGPAGRWSSGRAVVTCDG